MTVREIDLTPRRRNRSPSKQSRIERLRKRLDDIQPSTETYAKLKGVLAAIVDLLEHEL